MTDCIFCNKKEDIVFYTDNFHIKIGKGIICEGHCMIIPNKHCTCIAESCVDFMDEFLFLKDKLMQFLGNNFYVAFYSVEIFHYHRRGVFAKQFDNFTCFANAYFHNQHTAARQILICRRRNLSIVVQSVLSAVQS